MQPRVQRQRADDAVQPPDRLAEKLERERKLLVDERASARLGGRDNGLVRKAARVRARDDESFAFA